MKCLPLVPAETIDFSGLCLPFESTSVSLNCERRIKLPSSVLPASRSSTKRDAFRSGVKTGTRAADFFKFGPKMRELFGLLPRQEHGKIADEIDRVKNEARTLVADIETQLADLSMRAVYFIELDLVLLQPAVERLKTCIGLLEGKATIGCYGFISSAKTDVSYRHHPVLQRKAREQRAELAAMEQVLANANKIMNGARETCSVDKATFAEWKLQNGPAIEVSLNTAKAVGRMTGVAIQGSIVSAIHFGIAVALANPVVFAAGVYYAASMCVRVGGIAAKTGLENALIQSCRSNAASLRVKLYRVEQVEMLHTTTDAVMQKTVWNVAIAYASLPVALVVPPGTVFYHATNLIPALHYQNPAALKTVAF